MPLVECSLEPSTCTQQSRAKDSTKKQNKRTDGRLDFGTLFMNTATYPIITIHVFSELVRSGYNDGSEERSGQILFRQDVVQSYLFLHDKAGQPLQRTVTAGGEGHRLSTKSEMQLEVCFSLLQAYEVGKLAHPDWIAHVETPRSDRVAIARSKCTLASFLAKGIFNCSTALIAFQLIHVLSSQL